MVTNAQYNLEWDEHAYLAIPDAPYDGYIASATWNVNNRNLTFKEADEAGAIIYPNHYFEGTSLVTCNYRYEYYLNGNYRHQHRSDSEVAQPTQLKETYRMW